MFHASNSYYIIKTMKLPTLNHEIELWRKGFTVIGIDEVGRGAFAGPLVVGGVVFQPTASEKRIANLLAYGINDSKKLLPHTRKLLSKIIQSECLAFHISKIEVAQINRIGIGKATLCAMRDVVKHLREKLNTSNFFCLVDGFYIKNLKGVGLKNQKGIIGGDGISLSIAAASIIAKVYRDEHMEKLSDKHPEYLFAKNKGYGTVDHRAALKKYGSTRLHRTDFIENYI